MGARLGLLVILALGPSVPTSAQGLFAGDKITNSIVGGEFTNSTLTIGMSVTEMLALTDRLLSPDPSVRADAMRRIEAMLPQKARLQAGAVAVLLDALGKQDLPAERLPDYFAEVAESFLKAQEEIAAFRVDDPVVAALRDSAATALGAPVPDQDAADRDLREATALAAPSEKLPSAGLSNSNGQKPRSFANAPWSPRHAFIAYTRLICTSKPRGSCRPETWSSAQRTSARGLGSWSLTAMSAATMRRSIEQSRSTVRRWLCWTRKLRLRNGRSLSMTSAWHSGPSVSAIRPCQA